MALRSLDQLRILRIAMMRLRIIWLRCRGVNADRRIRTSLSSRLSPSVRGSIVIGPETLIAFKVLIFTRDSVTGEDRPVRIGSRCFIGGGSLILPGVTIGDECIIGGGAVVFEDVPARSVVGGNPGRILRRNIRVGPFGRLQDTGMD